MKTLKTISKWMAGAALAGALFFAAPQKSQAQVAVGVRIGGPVYGRPAYRPYYRPYGYRYYAPRPVYYAPQPVYVAPPPPVYYAPRPVYVAPRPYYRPGVSFGVVIR